MRLLICAALAVTLAACTDDKAELGQIAERCTAMYPAPEGGTPAQVAQAHAFAADCYATRANAIEMRHEMERQRAISAYGAMRAGGAFGPVPVRVVP